MIPRTVPLAVCLSLAAVLPAAAQTDLRMPREPGLALKGAPLAERYGARLFDAEAGDSPWLGGVFLAPRGGQGFNLARPAPSVSTADRQLFERLPDAPQLAPRGLYSGQEAGAYVGYRLRNWTFGSGVRQALDVPGRNTTRLDLGAAYGFNVTERNLVTLSGGLTVGSRTAGLGYDPLGVPLYASGWTPRTGEPGAGLRVSWLYSLDRNLYLSTTLGYDRFQSDDGMFGLDRGAASFGTVFGYRFY